MEILEAFDLTGSYRAAAGLAGCDHHTVARYVALREAGQPAVAREHRARPIDEDLDKIEELVARSNGRVRGRGARPAGRDGLHRWGAHHPPGGGGGEGAAAGRA